MDMTVGDRGDPAKQQPQKYTLATTGDAVTARIGTRRTTEAPASNRTRSRVTVTVIAGPRFISLLL
jgi:hypothetical protein